MDKKTLIQKLLEQNLPIGEPVTERQISIVAKKLSVLPESVDWGDAEQLIKSDKELSVDWGDAEEPVLDPGVARPSVQQGNLEKT